MKRINKILIAVISLIVISLTAFVAYSFLIDTDEKGSLTYELGELKYSVSGSLKANYLYPGTNIVSTDYKLKDHSNIATEVRIKIIFYLDDIEIDINDYIVEDSFDFNINSDWQLGLDNYYYYLGTAKEVTLFTQLILDGHVIKSNYANSKLTVKIEINAKQKDHVDWLELASKFTN